MASYLPVIAPGSDDVRVGRIDLERGSLKRGLQQREQEVSMYLQAGVRLYVELSLPHPFNIS